MGSDHFFDFTGGTVLYTQLLPSIIQNQSFIFVFTPLPIAPTCSLTADRTSITSGQQVILMWSTTGSPTTQSMSGMGTVTGNALTVFPTTTTTYILTVSNVNGSSICQVTITVGGCPDSVTSQGRHYPEFN